MFCLPHYYLTQYKNKNNAPCLNLTLIWLYVCQSIKVLLSRLLLYDTCSSFWQNRQYADVKLSCWRELTISWTCSRVDQKNGSEVHKRPCAWGQNVVHAHCWLNWFSESLTLLLPLNCLIWCHQSVHTLVQNLLQKVSTLLVCQAFGTLCSFVLTINTTILLRLMRWNYSVFIIGDHMILLCTVALSYKLD